MDYRRSRDGQHYSKCLYSRLPEKIELKNGCIAFSLGDTHVAKFLMIFMSKGCFALFPLVDNHFAQCET